MSAANVVRTPSLKEVLVRALLVAESVAACSITFKIDFAHHQKNKGFGST